MGKRIVLAFIFLTIAIVIILFSRPTNVPKKVCPIENSTYSFCFEKNGKAYYFEVLGWVPPNATIMERYIKPLYLYSPNCVHCEGLVLFLAVRTNIKWRWYGSSIQYLIGELFSVCFYGSIHDWLLINNDTFLINYVLGDCTTYYRQAEYLAKSNTIRLYFSVYNLMGLSEGGVIKIGEISLVPDDEEVGIYINYPAPRFNISVNDIKYIGENGGYTFFNISIKLNNCGLAGYYKFDELGRKNYFYSGLIPLYIVTVERFANEYKVVEQINETHYLVTERVGYDYGWGLKDVWVEPEHSYRGSYATHGDTIWLKVYVWKRYGIDNTYVFITPWGEKHTVKV